MGLRALAERWIALRNTARPSPNTTRARRGDLVVIAKLLAPGAVDPPPAASGVDPFVVLDRVEVDDLAGLEDAIAVYAQTHAPASIRRVLSTWRGFCGFLAREGVLGVDPLADIEAPTVRWSPKPPDIATLADLARMAAEPSPRARHPWPQRDRALFALFAMAGLRVSEAAALTVGDTRLGDDPPRLRVTGKANKPRTIPLPPEAVTILTTYLQDRTNRGHPTNPDSPLLLHHSGTTGLNRNQISYLVRTWFRRAGHNSPPGAEAHSIRHAYATALIDSGARINEVQALLGHADLSSTQIYLGITADGLTEAAYANPLRHLTTPQQPQPPETTGGET
ncbi:MAG: tyrosine-type recombinase/integrase [Sulfitobacter sp.]|nr:tyrosine-type recombinase/integrase [Sulfitobacter sp.]